MGCMALPQEVHRFTVDKFLAIPDLPTHLELIDGVICDMPPEGPSHAFAQRDLFRALLVTLPDHEVLPGGSIQVSPDYCPIPDIAVYRPTPAVYRGGVTDVFDRTDLLLVVEVGVSTSSRDLAVKLPRYALGSVPEVWLVNPDQQSVTCFRDPDGDTYVTAFSWTFPAELQAMVENFKARLP